MIYSFLFAASILGIIGINNCYNLWRADYYFEKGRKGIIGSRASSDENVKKSLRNLIEANKIYPREPFYAQEFIRALGIKARLLMGSKKVKDGHVFYLQSNEVMKNYEKTTWTPDILYLTMGINSYKMGYIDNAIYFFEKAVKHDRWCFVAHTALGTFYHLRFSVMKNKEDLYNAFKHSYITSTQVLKYAPYWDKNAMINTMNYGIELYRETRDPEVLARLAESLQVYINFFSDYKMIKELETISSNTDYADIIRASRYFLDFRTIIYSKDIDNKTRLRRINEILADFNGLKSKDKNKIIRDYIRKVTDKKAELEKAKT